MKVNKIKIIERVNVGNTSLSVWDWDGRGDSVYAPRLSHQPPAGPASWAGGKRRRSSDPSFLLQDLERLFEANGIKVGSALTFLLTRWL